MDPIRIGTIGGSGLYRMDGLTDTREHTVDTPFGPPSDALLLGTLDGVDVAFLARHGRGHTLIPGQIPFRANIAYRLGCRSGYPACGDDAGSTHTAARAARAVPVTPQRANIRSPV